MSLWESFTLAVAIVATVGGFLVLTYLSLFKLDEMPWWKRGLVVLVWVAAITLAAYLGSQPR